MKKLLVLVLAITLGSPSVYAEEKGQLGFWEMLRQKVEHLVPQKKQAATTATGGVRGANISTEDVYWKGDAATHAVDAGELAAFQKGMDFVQAGDMKQAQAAFAEFVKNYPDGLLRKDADQALAALQQPQK